MNTTLRVSYVVRTLGIGIACIGLGLWGVYDYVVKIPKQEEFYQRLEVCQAVKTVLETPVTSPEYSSAKARANDLAAASHDATQAKMKSLVSEEELDRMRSAEGADDVSEDALTAMNEDGRFDWILTLRLFKKSMTDPPPASTTNFTGDHLLAHTIALQGIAAFEGVKKPGAFDRATQWAFILCIPFAPYLFWQFMRKKAATYSLGDDGAFQSPGGTFTSEEVVDVDMSRWMSKSIATVKTSSNVDVVMDDYVYKGAHLIVGALASRFYPDQWTDEAKPVKADEPDEEYVDEDGDEGFEDGYHDPEAEDEGAVDVHGDERNN